MNITKTRYIDINKYALIIGIIIYLVCIFTPIKTIQVGMIFVLGAGFFNLLHHKYFIGRTKLAAHIWLIPLVMGSLTYSILLQNGDSNHHLLFWIITTVLSGVPFILLTVGKTTSKPSRKPRLRIINARIIVQCITFMIYATVTATALIRGTRQDLIYWAVFHITTTALFPFLFGRVLCSWLCPNALFQDGLLKFLNYKRPINKLPRAIEEQSHSCAMNISGEVDKNAPLLPATLLLCWFPLFFSETVFDLVNEFWYPIAFMYGLFFFSLFLPWRKMCTHFCWLSSYRGLAGQASLWRIRFNKSKCKDCKKCKPEIECPFFIDIRNQDNEMPASCCTCFSCMENCPFEGVITYRRSKEEKARLKKAGKAA